MTVLATGAAPHPTWESIDWSKAQTQVLRLQKRIAKATQQKRWNKVRVLQRLLTTSWYAKALAVRQVSSNRGSRTPGVDGVRWLRQVRKYTAIAELKRRGYRPKPLLRKTIPKRNGKKRPLGIPTMRDRAMQALHAIALIPVAETMADSHSFGFRPGRSTQDAMVYGYLALAPNKAPQWVLEGDIKACFDTISHEWLVTHIPMDKRLLAQWLKAGFMQDTRVLPTVAGTPQGGIISPILANMALDGLQACAKTAAASKGVWVIRYADDWIVTAHDPNVLRDRVLPAVSQFLAERGMVLSAEKTHITGIAQGFDFLGFNFRKYGHKLLIKPSKEARKRLTRDCRKIFKRYRGQSAEQLIRRLNPKLRGWANYYRHVVSQETLTGVDHLIFRSSLQWCKRSHPKKSIRWVIQRYFSTDVMPAWHFHDRGQRIFLLARMPIRRHVAIKGLAQPFDPEYREYLKARNERRRAKKK